MNYTKINVMLCLFGIVSSLLAWYTGNFLFHFLFGLSFGQILVNYKKEKSNKE